MTSQLNLPRIPKNKRLSPADRKKFAKEVATAYKSDTSVSIRQICDETGRSFGNIYQLLIDEKVTLRGRGGRKRKQNLGKETAGHVQ